MRSKRVIINIILSVILQISTIICGFVTTKLIISSYGSNVNGLISSIAQFLGFITLIEAGFGQVIKSTLFKPIAKHNKTEIEQILKESEKVYRRISAIFVLYIFVLCIIFPLFFQKDFNNLYVISLIVIISLSTIAEYFFGLTYSLYLQAEQKKYVISAINIVIHIINTILVFILIKNHFSIQFVKLATVFMYIFRPILLNMYVKKVYKINIKNAVANYKIKQKWDGLVQHIAYVVHTNTDVAILTLFGNLTEISVYTVYVMIINKLTNIVQSFAGGIDATFGDMIAKNENDNLNKNFKLYELFYFTISTIIFGSTLFLIVPFIKVYTSSINDANYLRPVFATIIILAELIAVIRQPYNELIKVSGRFKETRTGALVEAFSNIIISVALVWKFGIVGVAIGTLVAMFIRAVNFVWYTSKYILKRSIWIAIKNFLVIAIEILIITVVMNLLPQIEAINYGTWILRAISVVLISSIVVILINSFAYKEGFKMIIMKIKTLLKNEKSRIIKLKDKIPMPIKNFFTKDIKMKMLVAYLIANLICILAGSYFFVSGNIKPNFSYRDLALIEKKLLEYNFIVFLVIVFEKKYKKNWSHLGILLIAIFALISTNFAINKSVALDGTLGRYEGLYSILYYLSVMLLTTFVSNKYKKVLAVTILLCGTAQAIYAICQCFNWFNVKLYYHKGKSWAVGLTNNPNFLGTYMLLGLSYSIGLFIDSKSIVKSILYALCMGLFMCGLLISNTTSCVVALIFVIIYVLIFCLKKEHYIKIITIFTILIFITCLIVKLGKTTLLNDFVKLKDETTEVAKGNLDDYYGTKRIYIWKETIKIVPKYLLHGVGIDNFTNAFDGRALTFRTPYKTVMYDKVHNEYLQILITQGIFSIICYVALYAYIVIKGVKYSFKQNQIYLILPVIGYIIQAFFNISVIEVAPIFFMALGMCVNKK